MKFILNISIYLYFLKVIKTLHPMISMWSVFYTYTHQMSTSSLPYPIKTLEFFFGLHIWSHQITPPSPLKSELLMVNFDILCGLQIWPNQIPPPHSTQIGTPHGKLRRFVWTSNLATLNLLLRFLVTSALGFIARVDPCACGFLTFPWWISPIPKIKFFFKWIRALFFQFNKSEIALN